MGDGGGGGDPDENGQDLTTLLGKILRIDVDPSNATGEIPYAIPADNPFVDNADAAPEIWAYGLRNPWRFSFDSETGDLFIGDVGQGEIEEIDYAPAGEGGQNYGWNVMEGMTCFESSDCDPDADDLVLPIAEYTHADGGCSVTGGYVYRGADAPDLVGTYLYGDYCSGLIWAATPIDDGTWSVSEPYESGFADFHLWRRCGRNSLSRRSRHRYAVHHHRLSTAGRVDGSSLPELCRYQLVCERGL